MRYKAIAILGGVALVGLGGWAAYEMQGADGSSRDPAAAPAAGELTAERLASLATAAMAGFQPAAERAEIAQDVELQGPDGPVTLSALKGQVLLVNLWAEWCAPCIEEMPTLDRLQAKLGGEDFRVLPISLDSAPIGEAQATLKRFGGAHLSTLADPNMALMAELGVTGLPSTLLIDRQGRELGRLIGPAEWDSPAAERLMRAAIAADG